ncbi:hypothetical protein MMC20_007021 [Loxospora ochrophaea]|nr:hypothetical protein [Loxospora ochrophaea]
MSTTLKPLTLHAHSSGPNPYKAAILLEALSLPYTVKLWEFGPGPNGVKGPAFLKINPNGRVPALEDPNTGVTSWESLAVLNYLCRTYDTSYKFHPSPDAPAQQLSDYDSWTSFLISTLGPFQGQVNWYKHYNGVENKNALERYEEQAYRCFGVLDEQLKKSGGKSILPGGYSAVDMHTYAWVNSYGYAGLSLDKYPNIKSWLSTTGEREDVKKAYPKVANGEKV